jgi:acyl transferase domain-containing protein/acyl carrier protein/NADP-dependent 3-hydroxy acid dehydrogenase YdfG
LRVSCVPDGKLGDDAHLMDIGLDSLGATDLSSKLSKRLGVRLLPTLIFNYPCIRDIAQHVGSLLGVGNDAVQDDAEGRQQQGSSGYGDIAIIGASCKFPGNVNSIHDMWKMLNSGRGVMGEASMRRWDSDALIASLDSPEHSKVLNRVRYGGFLSDEVIESFRASLFGISDAEACRMDPGQRLLLECSYDAFVDAGFKKDRLKGQRAGVFVGAAGMMSESGVTNPNQFLNRGLSVYDATGKALSVAAGRISFALGLQGPSFTTDTACSSSLVALHTAKRSLQYGDCNMAVVVGSSVLASSVSVAFAVAGMTSADGKCHTFDEAANGYCRGEGCGAVVLKRMEDAVRDGDSIYAVVKGSAVMQDGKSASLTAPNGLAQELMLKKALSDARLSPTDVCVIESHGTGTKLGDPIETGALVSVYGQERTADNPLYMSGVKANIGHLEAASGMAGLFALMLSLRYKRVPPNAQLKSLNEKIALTVDGQPVLFPTKSTPVLRPAGRPMVGAVSSLGYSGTIAHVILAEPTVQARDIFSPVVEHSETKSALWMFGGQGTLSLYVARELAETDEAFKAALMRCDAVLLNLTGRTASSILYPAATAAPDEALATLNSTQFAQPVLVILEYCLMERLLALGHRPVAVIGHSLGEYAAAVAAGVVTIEDCLRLVCLRAKLVAGCEQCRGSMVAVRASSSDALKAIEASGLGELVSVAAVNGASSTVLSGDATAVQRVLAASQWSSRALNVQNAFHSPLMNSIVAEYHAILDETAFSQPNIPFFSTVTGQEATAAITMTQYWVDHLLQPVLFKDALIEAAARGHSTFFEVGADTSLTKLARSVLGAGKRAFVDSKDILLSHAPSTVDATQVATRYPMGVTPHRMVQSISREAFAERTVVTCRLHSRILNDWLADHVVHDNIILPGAALLEMALAVAGRYYSPNGDLASSGADWLCVSGFSVTQPVVVTDVRGNLDPQSTAEWLPTTTLTAAVDYAGNVEVFGAAGNDTQRTLHMQACIGAKFGSGLRYGECGEPDWSSVRAAAQHAGMACDKVELGCDLYKSFAASGLKLGSTFQLLAEARCSPDKCIGKLNITNRALMDDYLLPPCLVDAMMHPCAQLVSHYRKYHNLGEAVDARVQVPYSFDEVWLSPAAAKSMWDHDTCTCYIEMRSVEASMTVFDCALLTKDGTPVLVMKGVYTRALGTAAAEVTPVPPALKLRSTWVADSPLVNSTSAAQVLLHVYCSESDRALAPADVAAHSIGDLEAGLLGEVYFDWVVVSLPTVEVRDSAAALRTVLSALKHCCRIASGVLLVSVNAGDDCDSVQAAWAGAVLCAQQEYARVDIRHASVTDRCGEYVWNCVNSELASPQELEVRYGANDGGTPTREVRRFSELSVPSVAAVTTALDGSFVITGGLGGLGLQTAKVLAQQSAKHLFLVSRSGKVSHEGQGLEEDLRWLQEESGAVVHIFQCDVSNEAAVAALLEEVRAECGNTYGVIHCAGAIRDGTIHGDAAAAGSTVVWQSKALSAWWLHKLSGCDTVTSFIMLSSIVSAVGNIGQSAYGAANRFLDELVLMRNRLGLPGRSVQLPAIARCGMAAASLLNNMAAAAAAAVSVSSDVYRALVLELLSNEGQSGKSVLTVMPQAIMVSLAAKNAKQFEAVKVAAPADSGRVKASKLRKRSVRASANNGRITRERIRRTVVAAVQSLVGSDNVGEQDLLANSGVDSLGATELATSLSKALSVKFFPSLIFNYPTIADIVAHAEDLLGTAETGDSAEPHLATKPQTGGDMAVVGVSCRFPGDVNSMDDLWQVLMSKRDLTGEVSPARWDADAIAASMGRSHDTDFVDRIRNGGFLSDTAIESFQAQLFGISDAEATRMDPGQRLLLDVSYEALTDAGYSKQQLVGQRAGVFVGAAGGLSDESYSSGQGVSVYDATGKALSVAAGRISFALGLQGPCFTTDTACSSSLVALHTARRSLQSGDCNMAVVVGMSVLGAPASVAFAVAGMTSPDGKCHTFDEAANGYCRGEGCGAVVLKRMEDAVRDGDSIYAVVKGSAVMQDGKSASLTAPNGRAQELLLRSAVADAGIRASDVSYIEAHGTGTKLGDPIEVEALAAVYASERSADAPLFVAGVKANMGHLEAASGMAGLLSAILAVRHATAPPNAQLHLLNAKVATAVQGLPIVFPTASTTMTTVDKQLLAGVSSFGYSGTIAHVIISSAPKGAVVTRHPRRANNNVVWQYSGQGTLTIDVARSLWETSAAFRTAMDRCDAILLSHMGRTASGVLYPGPSRSMDAAAAELNDTRYAQPALVALQCCLTEHWKAQGFTPAAVMGHSLGEYAAAVTAGIMTLEECLRLVAARAQLVHAHDGWPSCTKSGTSPKIDTASSRNRCSNAVSSCGS